MEALSMAMISYLLAAIISFAVAGLIKLMIIMIRLITAK